MRAQPRKALALYLRYGKNAAPDAVLCAVKGMVVDLLEQPTLVPATNQPAVTGVWLNIAAAAGVLGLQRTTLTERLRQVRYRYMYGWPYWDGHAWSFSSAALDPASRAEFMARLPKQEPDAHVAMLPDWCERQAPEDDADAA